MTRLLVVFVLATSFVMGCRTTGHQKKRGPRPIDSEVSAAPNEEAADENLEAEASNEAEEGVVAYFADISSVALETPPAQNGTIGRGITIKIKADAFKDIPSGELVSLVVYRLHDRTPEALQESNGMKRLKAMKVAAMDVEFREGKSYEFPIVDTSGEYRSPLVLKIVPAPLPPDDDTSILLPTKENKIRGVYRFPGEGKELKVFDAKTLRKDIPGIFTEPKKEGA